MSGRNWMTAFTLIGLVVGGMIGEVCYRQTATIEDAGVLLQRHDQLVAMSEEGGATWTPILQVELDRIRDQARPALRVRTFEKLASYVGRDVFMGLLKMLIIPLIIASVVTGVTSAGNFARLRSLAGRTVLYFFSTMLIAVVLGMTVVTLIGPGIGFFDGPGGEEEREAYLMEGESRRGEIAERQRASGVEPPKTTLDALMGIVARMVPTNPIRNAADGETLPVIVFSILFGVIVSMIGPRGQPIIDLARAVMDVMIRMTEFVLYLAPVGVFFLVALAVSGIGIEQFAAKIGLYMVTVIVALLLHGFVVLPSILAVFGRVNPIQYLTAMKDALLLAFSTASSSATLPVTIDCARTRGGCSRRASGFVLPLGSTINMDGTALYEAVAVIFLAQAFTGGTLPARRQDHPGPDGDAGGDRGGGHSRGRLTTMLIVITAVNAGGTVQIPLAAIGLILGVDRILDMTRTMINVWGDAIGARILTRFEPEEAEEGAGGAT